MSAGRSTINTVLKVGATAAAIAQISKIKSYPQLGGEPESLETTDLEDVMQTFVLGVQQTGGTMQFTYNHDTTAFAAYKALEGTEQVFELSFGASGVDGKYSWKGYCSTYVNEGSVNGIREMTLSVVPTTEIHNEAAATAFPTT